MGLLRGVMAGMSFLAILVGFGAMVLGLLGALGGDSLGWAIGAAGLLLVLIALLLLSIIRVER